MKASSDGEDSARALVELLEETPRVVGMTGAGASAASGVPTYRGAGGSWSRYDPAKYASIDHFRRDPTYYWRFFRDERYPALSRAKPNPVHTSLAALERQGRMTAVVTQNIDGLHQAAGSQRVLELHGNSHRFRCETCSAERSADVVRRLLDDACPPKCPDCGQPSLRPDVVLFGETLPTAVLAEAAEEMTRTDLVVVVGSSLVVEPAASLPLRALGQGAKLAILNVDPTPLDRLASLVVREPADTVLPVALESMQG
jgi:NAD-dependent deacetylase